LGLVCLVGWNQGATLIWLKLPAHCRYLKESGRKDHKAA
jgi:hypothetical protein